MGRQGKVRKELVIQCSEMVGIESFNMYCSVRYSSEMMIIYSMCGIVYSDFNGGGSDDDPYKMAEQGPPYIDKCEVIMLVC